MFFIGRIRRWHKKKSFGCFSEVTLHGSNGIRMVIWASFHSYGSCATYQYPEYCLSENYGAKGLVDDLFKNDDLVKAYCKTALLLQECVNDACRLCRIYTDTLTELSAIKAGKLKKSQDWYGKVLKNHETLFTYWKAQHYVPAVEMVNTRNDFETFAEALERMKQCLEKLHRKVQDAITQ